jgi:hypothetical protein
MILGEMILKYGNEDKIAEYITSNMPRKTRPNTQIYFLPFVKKEK